MTRLIALVLLWASSALALEPVHYTIRCPSPHRHELEVELKLPKDLPESVELYMPAWTPGSYLIRDFARNLSPVRRADGSALPKTRTNRWRVSNARGARLSYTVYGREPTARTNWIEPEFALLNGGATFLGIVEPQERAYQVRLMRPAGWPGVASPLAVTGPDQLAAQHYRHLVDAPIVLGRLSVHPFQAAGEPHRLTLAGEGPGWKPTAEVADLKRVVEASAAIMGSLPYQRYDFLVLGADLQGGLEHADSAVLLTPRRPPTDRRARLEWLRLAAHEHFHAWNVKALTPRELLAPDLEREVLTESLWVVEGITAYYDVLVLRRARLVSTAELLERLSEQIRTVQQSPGRQARSLIESSVDSWIKYYRPDENSQNSAVDYYAKGALVAFLLDVELRAATAGKASLDELLRRALARFGKGGYALDEFHALASEVAGTSLHAFFQRAVYGRDELNYGNALSYLGLRFAVDPDASGYLGVRLFPRRGQLLVREVLRGSPADLAQLSVDDELIAVNGERVPPSDHRSVLGRLLPGQKVELLISRRGALITTSLVVGATPSSWRLEVDPAATPEARAHLMAWVTGE